MMSNACAMNERILLFECTSRRAEQVKERQRKEEAVRQAVSVYACVCVVVSVVFVIERERDSQREVLFQFHKFNFILYLQLFLQYFIVFSFRALVRIGTFLFCFMSIPVTVHFRVYLPVNSSSHSKPGLRLYSS